MLSFKSLSLWTALLFAGASSVANAAPATDCNYEMFCGSSNIADRSIAPTPTLLERNSLTNAERLARGLPLKAPSRRDEFAARSQPSSVPQTKHTGYIVLKRKDNEQTIGYISTAGITNAGQVKTSTNAAEAIKFEVQMESGATSGSQLGVTMLNSPGPFFGLVQGRDNTNSDLSSTSFHYLYLNGVHAPGTQPGATPSNIDNNYETASGTDRLAESSVWNLDLATNAMSPQWINSDGSAPVTETFTQGNYLYAGGSAAQFGSRYPSPIIVVTLHWEPAVFA